MSVNISVSGKTLKECHDQILALAEELTTTEVKATQGSVMAPNGNVIKPMNTVSFPIQPEVTEAPKPGPNSLVDARGLPWDLRIHSGNREMTSDGKWRKRRGVDDETVAAVEAELRGKATINPVAPAPAAPLQVPTTEVRAKLPEEANVLASASIPPAIAPTFAAPMQQPVLPPNTFTYEMFKGNLIKVLNDLIAEKKIDAAWIEQTKGQFAGKDVVQWHENEMSCQSLFEAFVSWGFINKA